MRQRKTNDQEILRLLQEGKNQKEIAHHFGVSPVAIHKRLKRLTLPPPPESLQKLTQKEQKFCIAIAQGKTQTKAAMDSYDVSSRESAKVMGSQLMAKPEIQMSITELMNYCGIDKPYRIRRLKQIIDSSDLNIAHKGLDMSFRLDKSYPPLKLEQRNFSINISDETMQKMLAIMDISKDELMPDLPPDFPTDD